MANEMPLNNNNYNEYKVSDSKSRPQNIDAEESILGGILLDPGAFARIDHLISSQDFYVEAHRIIFQIAKQLYSFGEPIDLMTVTSKLEDLGLLEKIGGTATLVRLASRTVSTVNIDRYAELVKDKSLRRELISFLWSASDKAVDSSIDLPEIENYLKNYFTTWNSGNPLGRYKRELIQYDKIKDPIAKRFRKRQLCKEYKVSQRDFEQDVIEANEDEKRRQEKIRYTLAELAEMPDAELDFLVPGLTPRGEGTIITGPPKACKTLFTIDLIDSLLSGGSFMDRPVPKSKVVYFNCDQSVQMFRSQLQGRGILELAEKYGGESLIMYSDMDLEKARDFADILDRDKPDAVFIDSLTGLIKDPSTNICDPSIRAKVERFFKECEKRNISLYMIHHNGKSDSNQGSQKMLGSALFAAIPSAIITLEPIDPKKKSDTRRILKTDLRFGGNVNWECDINPYYEWHKDGCLKFAKNLDDPTGEIKTMSERILTKIENSELDRIEVAELVAEENNKRNAYKAITRLKELQLIDRKLDERDKRRHFVLKKRKDNDKKTYSANTTSGKLQHSGLKKHQEQFLKDQFTKSPTTTELKNSAPAKMAQTPMIVETTNKNEQDSQQLKNSKTNNSVPSSNTANTQHWKTIPNQIPTPPLLLSQYNTTQPGMALIYKSQKLVNLRLEDIKLNEVEYIKEYGEAKLYSTFISGDPAKLKLADPYGWETKDFCLEKAEAIYLKE